MRKKTSTGVFPGPRDVHMGPACRRGKKGALCPCPSVSPLPSLPIKGETVDLPKGSRQGVSIQLGPLGTHWNSSHTQYEKDCVDRESHGNENNQPHFYLHFR